MIEGMAAASLVLALVAGCEDHRDNECRAPCIRVMNYSHKRVDLVVDGETLCHVKHEEIDVARVTEETHQVELIYADGTVILSQTIDMTPLPDSYGSTVTYEPAPRVIMWAVRPGLLTFDIDVDDIGVGNFNIWW
jgi:hypothetical protein